MCENNANKALASNNGSACVSCNKTSELVKNLKSDLDIRGCNLQFVKGFATNKMKKDFSIIANSFYMNVPESLTYKNYEFYTDSVSDASYPYEGFIIFTMSQILSMAYSANEYSIQLLRYLYSIYYRKEYKQVKNWRSASANRILEISGKNIGNGISTIARILTMCRFLNINIDEDCLTLYSITNEYNKQDNQYINMIYWDKADDEQYNKMAILIKEIYGVDSFDEIVKLSTQLSEHNRFRQEVYHDLGFRFESSDIPKDSLFFEKCFTHTLFILKKINPDKKYTIQELQEYVSIYYDVFTICNTMDGIDEYFKRVLGEVDDFIVEQSEFDPKEFEQFAGLNK